ncbi:MAG: glycosyltransferase [Candidatus Sulfopaludibacter sp.]|nr:glycosyltransferase [Candidatus Sulfopaludibacter sp.]
MISAAVQLAAMALFVSGVASFVLLLKGCFVLRRQARRSATDTGTLLLKSPQVPNVSVVAVASDCSPETRSLVRRLIDLHYSNHEVVLVLDGVSAEDFEHWIAEFHLAVTAWGTWKPTDPLRLSVLRTERAGTAAAYNAGIAVATGSLIAFFDAASEFSQEALLRLLPPMLQDPERTTAVCAMAPVLASTGLMQRFSAIESVRVWLGRYAAFTGWNMLVPVPGCCLLIRRDAIRRAGGFPPSEDRHPDCAAHLELVLNLHGRARAGGPPFRMTLAPDPISHLPAPKSSSELRRILDRDQCALKAAIVHRKSIGAIGWGLPALLWDRLARPLLETALYVVTAAGLALGLVPFRVVLLVLLCTVATGILVSMAAVVLRELADFRGGEPGLLVNLFFAAVPENLGYRQLRNLWLIEGFLKKKTR